MPRGWGWPRCQSARATPASDRRMRMLGQILLPCRRLWVCLGHALRSFPLCMSPDHLSCGLPGPGNRPWTVRVVVCHSQRVYVYPPKSVLASTYLLQWAVVALPSRGIRRLLQSFCSCRGFLCKSQGAGSKLTLSRKMLFGYDATPEGLLDEKT